MTISTNALAAVTAQETGEFFCALVTISHESLEEPIRVTNAGEDVVSNGNTFTALPFDIVLPSSEDGVAPSARLSIDNIDRQIVLAVRSMTSAPDITVQVILFDTPDVIEKEWADFMLYDVTYDAWRVEGTLKVENFTSAPYPGYTFSPNLFPGII